jgi:uncharacterized protein YndB with AHSA1/START domain
MNETTVTTPNELEIRVERVFDAPPEHVFSVWTDPQLIPEWWGEGTVVEEMDVRPGGTYRFRTAFGLVEGEFIDLRVCASVPGHAGARFSTAASPSTRIRT